MAEKDARRLVSEMTLEEKAGLCSGLNFWFLKGVERLGLPSIMVTDGPHGLRKQVAAGDHLGINHSVPATCFPAASATACSFDRDLLREVGRAMGEECLQEDVAVILGPGANIKRSPLCGRNFEYFSEDPVVSGELAAALIQGVQEKGVGTSLKHYAVNNQETRRMTIDAIADDRALYEIYLKSFEIAVKKGKPWTLMCSYNRINGVYACEDPWLLTTVLRDRWGFEGLVVTDWGAMDDRVEAVKAGLDLEMPHTNDYNDQKIIAAVKAGTLPETAVDALAVRITDMILKAQAARQPGYAYDMEQHHSLARKAAAQSCVLLKNDGAVLPLKPGAKVAVIGAFAQAPRYQGAGSSKINPHRVDDARGALTRQGVDVSAFAAGYAGVDADETLIAEAVAAAKAAEVAVVFAGLPDEYESEGFDRRDMAMPASHVRLIEAVAAANPQTVVVLQLGAPVVTDWADKVKGLLVAHLGGQAVNSGVADVLTGAVNPGGKLAESWPRALADNPSFHYFPGGGRTVEYRESVFVGYRYYETARKAVAWPFGYGLSYTSFAYSDLRVDGDEVRFTLENTGDRPGAETALVYLGLKNAKVYRPAKWLAAFEKVFLQPGEKKEITVTLERAAFQYYSPTAKDWRVEGGSYTVTVGGCAAQADVDGDDDALPDGYGKGYAALSGNDFSAEDFAAVYGRDLPPAERVPDAPYTVNDTLSDIAHTTLGGRIMAETRQNAEKALGSANSDLKLMVENMLKDMPLRGLGMMAGDDMPPDFAELLVKALNGGPVSRALNTLRFAAKMSKAGKK